MVSTNQEIHPVVLALRIEHLECIGLAGGLRTVGEAVLPALDVALATLLLPHPVAVKNAAPKTVTSNDRGIPKINANTGFTLLASPAPERHYRTESVAWS